jgi:hypothetical protein
MPICKQLGSPKALQVVLPSSQTRLMRRRAIAGKICHAFLRWPLQVLEVRFSPSHREVAQLLVQGALLSCFCKTTRTLAL